MAGLFPLSLLLFVRPSLPREVRPSHPQHISLLKIWRFQLSPIKKTLLGSGSPLQDASAQGAGRVGLQVT